MALIYKSFERLPEDDVSAMRKDAAAFLDGLDAGTS